MKNLEVKLKYTNEDMVYVIRKVKVETTCHVCDGSGEVFVATLNNIKKELGLFTCSHCRGKGIVTTKQVKYVVCDEPFRINRITIDFTDNKVKYRGISGEKHFNLLENEIFATKELAQKKCDELNTPKELTLVGDIIIQHCMSSEKPCPTKLMNKYQDYIHKGKLGEIEIDENNILIDGYITYLVCKMLDIKEVEVKITRTKKEEIENETR